MPWRRFVTNSGSTRIGLGIELRPDQTRDKDSIQRGAISANIVGPVKVVLHSVSYPLLDICEPDTSANKGNVKFTFRFRTVDDVEKFARDILKQAALVREMVLRGK